MQFNPCGRLVDFLSTSVNDTIRPFRDSAIEVTRRWYRVPWGTPTLGVPSPFMSARYAAFDYLANGAGPVYPDVVSYGQRGTPDGLTYDHVCGTAADFEFGGLFDPAANVVYDDEWIPECCGRASVCATQLCGEEPLNDRPAAELWSYPIHHQDADEFTPVFLFQRALRMDATLPAKPGWITAYYPAGVAGDVGWSETGVASSTGVMESIERTLRRAADEAITERQDSTGISWTVEKGGSSGTLTARIVAGALEICGVNCTICAALMPADVSYRNGAGLFGSALPALTQVTPGAHLLHSVLSTTRYFQLVDVSGAATDVYPSDAVGAFGAVVFPPTGQAFTGLAVNTAIAMTNAVAPYFAWRFVRVVHPITGVVSWQVLKYRADGTAFDGSVTSVGISTSSAGLTVGVTDPTTTPALSVDLSDDLEQLVGFTTADAILAGDGAGAWVPVTIGDFLSFAGSVLDVVPPGVTSGQHVCAAFSITAATGVWQATGETFTLPEAGTYLVTGKVRGQLQPSAIGTYTSSMKLYDTTAAADVTNSETLLNRATVTGTLWDITSAFTARVTVTGASTLEVYAKRIGTSWTVSKIESNAEGYTVFDWVRLY